MSIFPDIFQPVLTVTERIQFWPEQFKNHLIISYKSLIKSTNLINSDYRRKDVSIWQNDTIQGSLGTVLGWVAFESFVNNLEIYASICPLYFLKHMITKNHVTSTTSCDCPLNVRLTVTFSKTFIVLFPAFHCRKLGDTFRWPCNQ